jgi:hypothetical protein
MKGDDSTPDGSYVLRLHVPSGGGTTFVVSDPIPVAADAAYMVTAKMQYYLNSDSDRVFFTIIQSDPSGNNVGIDEVTGIRGDNTWNWVPKGMLIRTKPGASSIRIRLGLVASTETSIDIDSVQ